MRCNDTFLTVSYSGGHSIEEQRSRLRSIRTGAVPRGCRRRRRKTKNSTYLVSLDPRGLVRSAPGYCGKLRSNFLGTEFTAFDTDASKPVYPVRGTGRAPVRGCGRLYLYGKAARSYRCKTTLMQLCQPASCLACRNVMFVTPDTQTALDVITPLRSSRCMASYLCSPAMRLVHRWQAGEGTAGAGSGGHLASTCSASRGRAR